MPRDHTEKKILIVSDSADELHSVEDLLTADLGKVWGADNDTEALRLFSELKPTVLILAFSEIEKAERTYLTFYRQCTEIQDIPHQTLVLCKSTEAKLAFSLCLSGTIDDYVVNRPLYDPYRLQLSVRQALDRRNAHYESKQLNRQLSGVGNDLHRFDESLSRTLTGGEDKYRETLRAFNDYSKQVGQQLTRLESNLADPALNKAINIIDRNALAQQFEHFRKKALGPETANLEKRLQEADTWFKQLTEIYADKIKPLRDEEFPPPLPEVLVVEDDPVYREMLVSMLETSGFRLAVAEEGGAALAELRRRKSDIILLDYRLPGLDGIDMLKRVKADPELRSIPVIMLTGISERDVVNKCIQVGALDFIVKPSDRNTILGKIRRHLPADARGCATSAPS